MKIIGIERMTVQQVQEAVARGGRFVVYQYCISVIVMTFRRNSHIHFVPPGTSALKKGAPFLATSLLVGWWGFPWGPIWTISTVAKNLGGGIDVTGHVMNSLAQQQQPVRAAGAAFPAPL